MAEPELNLECVTNILRFTAAADFRSCTLVSRLWLTAARDPSLPFWRVLNVDSYGLLSPPGCSDAFCGCRIARAVRRLRGVLCELDLQQSETCKICRARLQLVPATPTPLQAILQALTERSMPALKRMDFSALDASTTRLSDELVIDALKSAPAGGIAFPELRWLRLSRNPEVRGNCFDNLMAACPQLEELYLSGCRLRGSMMPSLAAASSQRALRINWTDDEAVPPVDVSCGVCGSHLYRNLRSYAKGPPSQPHITHEYYTNELPAPKDAIPLDDETEQLNCVRNCHQRYRLYLVDVGTGHIRLYGWRAGIAVGPEPGATVLGPQGLQIPTFQVPLALATPVAAAPPPAA